MRGKVLGQYAVEEEIGAGGMGVVYRAYDLRLNRAIALKLVGEHFRAEPASWARLVREAQAASALNHPNICTIYDVGEEDGRAYIAMELVEGRTLRAVVPSRGLPTEAVIRYGAQLAAALAHAHERGVFHGDLRSANVIVTPEDRLKVLDFGLATRTHPSGSATPSPGRAAHERPLADADLVALGALLAELATGEPPGVPSEDMAVRLEPAQLSRLNRGLREVIERCLRAGHPGGYTRANQALEDLNREPGSGRPLTLQVSLAKPSRRTWIRLSAIAAIVILLALLALWRAGWWRRAPPKAAGNASVRVWVNTRSGIYHCSGTHWYGTSRQGEYLTQGEAQAKGYRPAYGKVCP